MDLNTTDFINAVALEAKLTPIQTTLALKHVRAAFLALAQNEGIGPDNVNYIRLKSFGLFKRRFRPPRVMYRPQDHGYHTAAARYQVVFVPGKHLKDCVNNVVPIT